MPKGHFESAHLPRPRRTTRPGTCTLVADLPGRPGGMSVAVRGRVTCWSRTAREDGQASRVYTRPPSSPPRRADHDRARRNATEGGDEHDGVKRRDLFALQPRRAQPSFVPPGFLQTWRAIFLECGRRHNAPALRFLATEVCGRLESEGAAAARGHGPRR